MKINTTISLEADILAEARDFAASQRRSFSAQLEKWIEEKLSEEKAEKTEEVAA